MPVNNDLDQIIAIAEEAATQEEWRDFASYCLNRGKGVRKDALGALNSFLAKADNWPFAERLRISRWIAERRELISDHRLLLPQPIIAKLVSPTFHEWVKRDPLCAEAHFLAGILALPSPDSSFAHRPFYLRRAIALDPTHEDAKLHLLSWLINHIVLNQHELPCAYLGDAEADLSDLHEAETVAGSVADLLLRDRKRKEVAHLRKITSAWLSYRKSKWSDFAEWCAEHGLDLDSAE